MTTLLHRRPACKSTFTAVSLALMVLFSAPSGAQNSASQPSQGVQVQHDYNIAPGPLGQALLQLGEQSGGLQIVAPLSLTEQVRTGGVTGRLTTQEALARLLAGTGLSYRFNTPTSFSLFRIDNASKQTTLGTVRVEGSSTDGYGGSNGSTDVTATEGSGSYMAPKMGIGGKIAASAKDTPQAVSVLTHAQMQDQKITDLTQAMEQSTGITIQTTEGQPRFYTRGLEISRVQIDGSAPMDFSVSRRQRLSIDMALYDHVELLRGADGLFNGNTSDGESSLGGGVVNLVRKRPLDHKQITTETTVGSWNNFRNVLDVTGPIGFDNALRGRFIAVQENKNFFYDEAKDAKKILSGVLEADLNSDTQLRVGLNHTSQHSRLNTSGLSRYNTGADLNLPRNYSTVFPWNYQNTNTNEIFAQLDHSFTSNWGLKLNAAKTYQRDNTLISTAGVPYTSDYVGADSNGDGLSLITRGANSQTRQFSFDGSLTGKFQWWNLPQQFVFGGNYKTLNGSSLLSNDRTYYPFNVFTFNRYDYAKPDLVFDDPDSSYQDKQWGLYSWINLSPLKDLYFKTGVRLNYNRNLYSYQNQSYTDRRFQKPYYALSYNLTPAWTIYGSYTDINQSQASLLTKSRTPLEPMVGNNKEVGIKFGDEKLTASISIYRLEQSDMQITDGLDWSTIGNGPSCCYKNDPSLRISKGIDIEIAGQISPGWQIAAGYTYNENETRRTYATQGAAISTITPHHLFKLMSSYQFGADSALQNWRIGGAIKAQSSSYNEGTICSNNTCTGDTSTFAFTQGGYAVVSLFTNYRINQTWSLALNLGNIFDRRYYETLSSPSNGNYYGEPRSFKATLRGNF